MGSLIKWYEWCKFHESFYKGLFVELTEKQGLVWKIFQSWCHPIQHCLQKQCSLFLSNVEKKRVYVETWMATKLGKKKVYFSSFISFVDLNVDLGLFVCRKVISFWKVNFEESEFRGKYFSMFSSVMNNKLENTF